MSQKLRRLGALCDSLPESRLDEQYRTLSTAEQFGVIGGSAVAVVLLGTLVGEVFAEITVLVALAIGPPDSPASSLVATSDDCPSRPRQCFESQPILSARP